MVNYHTSTLLESSEHVFELIRYNFFGGAPPYRWLVHETKNFILVLSLGPGEPEPAGFVCRTAEQVMQGDPASCAGNYWWRRRRRHGG